MNLHEIEGAARGFTGKAETKFGEITGDRDAEAQGLIDQASGKVQDLYGRIKESVQDASAQVPDSVSETVEKGQEIYKHGVEQLGKRVGTQPFEALLLAGALGYLLGWAMHRRA
ncbi:CsbD family protein [Beijerinckia indica]|uniref:CsbD family protein n=1 Tax=Beijerinckia indica subsp. indica (strain ATCC 9039 / DSM 1715 / NCIMB 8712) TaxID=395963 RepID=B2ICK7_BEII9|nr:CsbD family protein [Beijerinckia indica]ACB93896.1 CsbD family protein [Beijerinckia indica subsp. indica ATCC 9039]